MKNTVIALFIILLTAQCRQRDPEVPPSLMKLVGTWQLVESTSSYNTTLVFALDTANPPRDITHFLANGQLPINTYNAFLSAGVDGYMVVTDVISTAIQGDGRPGTALQVESTYLTNLRNVVRYEMPTDTQLKLAYGGDKAGTLTYTKTK